MSDQNQSPNVNTMAEEVEHALGRLLEKYGFATVSAVLGWSCDLIVRAGREPAPVLVAFVSDFAAKVDELGRQESFVTADPVLNWARATVALSRIKR